MPATAFHGTPITPWPVIEAMGARAYCVSFYRPDQAEWVDANAAEWFGDCGTYSFWQAALRSGVQPEAVFTRDYLEAYYTWCRHWCLEASGRCKWVVIPDPIGTGTQELDALLREWPAELQAYGVPVYHLDEPIGRAMALLGRYGRLCVGATGEFAAILSPAFCERMDELFNAIHAASGTVPPVHMFRGLQLLKPEFDWPISSADSTDRARNHNRLKPLGERYLWAVRQSTNRWDAYAATRSQDWPPPRLKPHPDLFGAAA
jgi:hypothetical protein